MKLKNVGLLGGFSILFAIVLPLLAQKSETTLVDGSDPSTIENFTRIGNANWRFAEGALVGDGGTVNSFLVTKESYRDFQIRAEFWAENNTNSGIFIRCNDPATFNSATCYEVNIYDQRPDPTYGTGAIGNVAKVSPMPKAGGRWNTFVITAKGTHLIVELNGVKTVDVNDSNHAAGTIAL